MSQESEGVKLKELIEEEGKRLLHLLVVKRAFLKALKEDSQYQTLLQQHRQVKKDLRGLEAHRANLWHQISLIRSNTRTSLIKTLEREKE